MEIKWKLFPTAKILTSISIRTLGSDGNEVLNCPHVGNERQKNLTSFRMLKNQSVQECQEEWYKVSVTKLHTNFVNRQSAQKVGSLISSFVVVVVVFFKKSMKNISEFSLVKCPIAIERAQSQIYYLKCISV